MYGKCDWKSGKKCEDKKELTKEYLLEKKEMLKKKMAWVEEKLKEMDEKK